MKITITYETMRDGTIQGIVDTPLFPIYPFGSSREGLIKNLKLVADDIAKNELKDDPVWSKIDWNRTDFEFVKYPHERNKQRASIARLRCMACMQ